MDGVCELRSVEHDTVPDRIVAGTWAIAAVMTRGDVTVRDGIAGHLERVLDLLSATGAVIDSRLPDGHGFRVRMDGRPKSIDVRTLPYPGFPTDLQPMAIALNSIAQGS